jgi:hypothetical protein
MRGFGLSFVIHFIFIPSSILKILIFPLGAVKNLNLYFIKLIRGGTGQGRAAKSPVPPGPTAILPVKLYSAEKSDFVRFLLYNIRYLRKIPDV